MSSLVTLRSAGASLALGLAALMSPLMASNAYASGTFSGTVTGFFSNPVLSGNIIDTNGNPAPLDNTATAVTTGFGSQDITWGANAGYSLLSFVGDSFSGVSSGEQFHLGTIVYFNGTSALDTLIFGSSLHLLTGGVADELITNLNFVTTANTGLGAARDSDFIGFSGFSNTFNVFEGAFSSVELYGDIVGDPQLEFTLIALSPTGDLGGFIGDGVGGIPEPATWAMMLVGFGWLGAALRSSRRKAIATIA